MSKPRYPGISYSRFSDPKQAGGDSEDRQERMFRDFCQKHNLTPVQEVFADRGRSGYRDEHRKKGRLGQLIAMAKDGRFEPSTVIVIEAWDRLGRLRPDRQTDLVAELLRTGVRIGICRLDDIFCEDDFGTHKWTTLAVFIQLAYQESKQKAERVAASWQTRRKKAREEGRLMGNRPPAWLEVVNGQARVIPERAVAVRRIFELAAAGQGHTRIVSALQREKVPAFGRVVVNKGRIRSQFSGKWGKPYVALILNDRRVLGELQPLKDGQPDGAPLVGYYPAVVSEAEFALARAGQEERLKKDSLGRASGPRQSKYVNLFKGMLTHARDGEGFLISNSGPSNNCDILLVNTAGREGRAKCYTFPYYVFEQDVLAKLRELDPREILPRTDAAPSQEEVLRAKLANIRQDIARLQEDLKEGYSKALATVLRTKEAEEEEVAERLQEQLALSARPAERAMHDLPGLVEMIESAADPDEVRLKLRPILRRLIEQACVLIVPRGSFRLVAVQIFFTGGACRNYLLTHQTAGFRRPGGHWPPCSPDWATVAKNGELDLRKPEHAARLERQLLAIDLNGKTK